MAKKLLYSEVVRGNSSDEAQSEESGQLWLKKFQAEDEDTALHNCHIELLLNCQIMSDQ